MDINGELMYYDMSYPPEFPQDRNMVPTFYKVLEE
jgi:hypothetical protein